MVRQKDQFWAYAVDLTGRFLCNFCAKEYSGGASRIKYHLSGDRGWGIEICEKVPEEIKLEAHRVTGNPPKRAKTMATSTSVPEAGNILSSSVFRMPNSEKMDKSKLDTLFAKYIIANDVLFDATRSTIFTNFVNGVAEYGSSYELPSSPILKSQLIPNIKRQVREYVHNAITSSIETGCTLYYSSSLKSIFAYTPNGVVLIKSSKHVKEDIIVSAIKRIGAASVVQLIIDPKEDGINSAIARRFPSILQTPCAMRGINDVFQAICNYPFVDNILSLAIIIDHFICKYKINMQVQHKWGDYWGFHKLTSVSGIERRFYWGVYKLRSLLEVESKLRDLQGSIVTLSGESWKLIFEKGTTNFKDAKYIDFLIHCEEFWCRAKLVASILRPVTEAFYLVVGNDPSSGQLYEAMEQVIYMERYGEDTNSSMDDYFHDIQDKLNECRSHIIQPIHNVAAFLNPTYMCRRGLDEEPEMMKGIYYVCDNLVKNDDRKIFMEQVKQYRQRLRMSINVVMTKPEVSQTRIWWDCYGGDLHVLKWYAIRILNQPCSSSFCQQYQLHPRSYDDPILAINTMLMDGYKCPKTQMSESTVFNEQYERVYKRVIYWFKTKFPEIKDVPPSWLENMRLDDEEERWELSDEEDYWELDDDMDHCESDDDMDHCESDDDVDHSEPDDDEDHSEPDDDEDHSEPDDDEDHSEPDDDEDHWESDDNKDM